MNTVTHFFTGFLVARILFKKKNDHFLCLFAAMVAILPDSDQFIHLIIPLSIFEHAVFTHTIIGALLFTVVYTLIIWGIGRNFLKSIDVGLKYLFIIALAAIASHLILDIFTVHANVYTTNAHLYFWPFWDFSFHLNRFFPVSMSSQVQLARTIIEVIYTALIVAYIVFYQWVYKKENPFFMFFPDKWLDYAKDAELKEKVRKLASYLLVLNLAIIICMVLYIAQ